MPRIRLQKYLSQTGVCSRRRGEAYITAGRVAVNGVVVRVLGTRIDPAADLVTVDGRPVSEERKRVYLALHKPPGYVTTCDQPGRKIVIDLVDIDTRVYPVGRLDKDSSGLILMTNDGALHHRLLHPSFDHEKEYDVTVRQPLSDDDLAAMAAGVMVLGRKTRPAAVQRLAHNRFRIQLKEGRNRQIRRMVRCVGNRVVQLKRIRFAGVRLGNLPPGAWRHLTEKEKKKLPLP